MPYGTSLLADGRSFRSASTQSVVQALEAQLLMMHRYAMRSCNELGPIFSVDFVAWQGGQQGLEGLAYGLKGDRLFLTKERDPRQLLEVHGLRASLENDSSLRTRDLSSRIKDKVFATDLSFVVFDQPSGHLILLRRIEVADQKPPFSTQLAGCCRSLRA